MHAAHVLWSRLGPRGVVSRASRLSEQGYTDPAYELSRTSHPRHWVNKGKKSKCRGSAYDPGVR